jgi:hypothetical protein
MAAKTFALPPIQQQWINRDGTPTIPFGQAVQALASNIIGPLPSAANDAAAAAAGVQINQLYQNAGAVRIRLT